MHTGFFMERPEGRRPLGRPRRRWEDNTKMILKQWGGKDGTDSIHLAQDRDRLRALVNMVMNLLLPYNAGNFLAS